MFSQQDSPQMNEIPAKQKQAPTYDAIKRMIEGHFNYLMQHRVFLAKIDKGLKSDEDINDYLEDVIGISYEETIYSKKECLRIIKDKLDAVLELFAQLCLLNKKEQNDKTILIQYLLLEFCFKNSNISIKALRDKNAVKETIIGSAFNEYSHIKSLLKHLKPLLPESYKGVSKAILAETTTWVANRDTSTRIETQKSTTEIAGDLSFINDYQDALSSIDFYKYFDQSRKSINSCLYLTGHLSISTNSSINRILEIILIFSKGSQALQKLPDPTNNAQAVKNTMFELNEKIELYFEAKRILDEIQEEYDRKMRAADLHKALWPKLQYQIGQLELKYQLLKNEIKKSSANNKRHSVKDEMAAIKNNMADLDQQIKLLKEVWGANQKTQFDSVEDIENIEAEFNQRKKMLLQKIKLETNKLKTLENSSNASIKLNIEPQTTSNTDYAQRRQYLEQQLEKNKQYKEKIAQLREEKKQTKMAEKKPIVSTDSASQITIIKNVEMGELLEKLNSNQLKLLRKILSYAKDIKYTNVYHIITNHLDGEITEIGNGSSHKRIRLIKYYFEISSHQLELENETLAGSTVTGGFFKPHGKQHNSGIMSQFNLELVASTFMKAGITINVIDDLETKLACRI